MEMMTEIFQKLVQDENSIYDACSLVDKMHMQEGESFLQAIIDFTTSKHLQIALAYAELRLGWVYLYQSKTTAALLHHQKAYDLFTEQIHTRGLACASNALMADYATQELWDHSIDWGLKSLILAETAQDEKILALTTLNLSSIYGQLNQHQKSKDILERLEQMPYVLSPSNKVIKWANFALSELRLGSTNRALHYINKAWHIASKDVPSMLSLVLTLKGEIHSTLGNYEKATKYLEESIYLAKLGDEYKNLLDCLITYSKMELKLGHFESIVNHLSSYIQDIEKLKDTPREKEVYEVLYKAYKGLGDYENALIFLEKFRLLEHRLEAHKKSDMMLKLESQGLSTQNRDYKLLYEQTSQLSIIGQKLTSHLNLEDLFETIRHEVCHLIAFDSFKIALYDAASQTLDYVLALEGNTPVSLSSSLIKPTSLEERCIRLKEPLIEMDNTKNNQLLLLPLLIKQEAIGLIIVRNNSVNKSIQKDLNTLKILGTYLGIALENARLFEKIQYMSTHDMLTGLYTRREFMQQALNTFNLCKAKGDSLYVIMLDVDHFKQINDYYGHCAGDLALAKLSRILKETLPEENSILGRYGGEEFLIMLTHITLDQVYLLLERLRHTISMLTISYESVQFQVTISLGLSCYLPGDLELYTLIDHADQALYKAKSLGRNQLATYA